MAMGTLFSQRLLCARCFLGALLTDSHLSYTLCCGCGCLGNLHSTEELLRPREVKDLSNPTTCLWVMVRESRSWILIHELWVSQFKRLSCRRWEASFCTLTLVSPRNLLGMGKLLGQTHSLPFSVP